MSALLAQGGVALVVGAQRRNVGDYLFEHKQLVYYSSEDVCRRGLPTNTRAVVLTRFMRHAAFAKVVDEAKKRGLTVYPIPTSTGELKKTLMSMLPPPAPPCANAPMPPPAVEISPLRVAVGTLQRHQAISQKDDKVTMVDKTITEPQKSISHAVRDLVAGGITDLDEVIRRLRAEGYTSSRRVISTTLWKAKQPGAMAVRTYKPRRRRQPAAVQTSPAAAKLSQEASADEMVKLVDDAILALTLVREQVAKQATDRAALKAQLDRLRSEL